MKLHIPPADAALSHRAIYRAFKTGDRFAVQSLGLEGRELGILVFKQFPTHRILFTTSKGEASLFVVSKLLTERAHKGTKDKIQALLVLAERASGARFTSEVVHLLRGVDPVRIEDLRAGAQDAYIALARDPRFSDAGAEGYSSAVRQAKAGLERLFAIVEPSHG